jgi:hypothetical protein
VDVAVVVGAVLVGAAVGLGGVAEGATDTAVVVGCGCDGGNDLGIHTLEDGGIVGGVSASSGAAEDRASIV